MNVPPLARDESTEAVVPPTSSWLLGAFAGATFLGAFLLFMIQPLMGKFILPRFGGATAVWTTCMLFFQVALFAGYLYSHLLAGCRSLRAQALFHGLLLAAAMATLPVAVGESRQPASPWPPTVCILWLLTTAIGLPYLVLSSTGPMLQAWFNRGFPGRNPYRLYALSNAGSFAALLSYPFLVEPSLDLGEQARVWSWAFAVYALMTVACGAVLWRLHRDLPSSRAALGNASEQLERQASGGVWLDRASWLLLPACASLVLLSTTNRVCQDVAAVPFLWVAPLALYLLTFVVCFDRPGRYRRPLWSMLTVLGIVAVTGGQARMDTAAEPFDPQTTSPGYAYELFVHLGTMFCICMLCHGELARRRPAAFRLTEFYLVLSAGGALGGLVAALVAPQVFNTFLEWNLGMLAAYALAAALLLREACQCHPRRLLLLLLAGFAVGGFIPVLLWQGTGPNPTSTEHRLVQRRRNFYGVVSVSEMDRNDPQRHRVRMHHGVVLHGVQFRSAERRGLPTAYFTRDSGVGRAIGLLQERKKAIRVGVAGLGAGTLACYARPGDHFIFYELNPAVIDLAGKHFTYLEDARQRGATVEVIPGDARLSLDREASRQFDLLILDAFSGDSVPVHLLTREAAQIYRRHVAADGTIALNITNSYLYLFPVARALAEDLGYAWRRVYLPPERETFRFCCDWFLMGGGDSPLGKIENVAPPPARQDDFSIPVWTDRRHDQFRILIGVRG